MADIDEHLTYYRQFRDQILEDLVEFRSGLHFTGEIRDGRRIDTTPETIADLERQLAYIEKIIAAYEAKKNATGS